MRDFSTSVDQPPIISINLFDVAGEDKRKLRFLILPIGMLLKSGFRVIVDKTEPLEGKYDMCFQNACSAEIEIGARTVETLKKGQNMAVVMRVPGGDSSGRELTFNIPLKDLGPAFDGQPTDPKVLEQQRQALLRPLAIAGGRGGDKPRAAQAFRGLSLGRASVSTQARAVAGAICAVFGPIEGFSNLRVPNGLSGLV
jgi:hypothetical protein